MTSDRTVRNESKAVIALLKRTHRRLAKFGFRYNNRHVGDVGRTVPALAGTVSKKLIH
jgi:hypothetical protein